MSQCKITYFVPPNHNGMAEEKKIYYVLKVQGKAKIPDYLQVRDADFTLIGYFRPQRSVKTTRGPVDSTQEIFSKIEAMVEDIPFGQITKVEL